MADASGNVYRGRSRLRAAPAGSASQAWPATATGPKIRPPVARSRKPNRRDRMAGWTLVAPAFAFVAVFVLFPLGFAVYMSLTNWPLVGPYHFVGLDNYRALGGNSIFMQSVIYTLEYTGIVTGPIFVLGYGLAVLVRSNRRGATVFRTIFFLPFVVGLATESFMLVLEVRPQSGVINQILHKLGITNGDTAWLVHTGLATGIICVLVTWYACGLTMLILMAGMQGIPRDLYESAEVDGATWLRREVSITLPLLRRPIALSLILSVVGSLLGFNQFYILTQGGPGTSTDTVVMWIYQTAFVQLHLGPSAAMALVLVVGVGLVTALQFLLLRDETEV